MINLLSGRKNIVLATGGGAVLDKKSQTVEETRLGGLLRASIKQQIHRTARDRHRPLLQNRNPEQTIKDLMVVREPLYLEVADVVVDTNRRNPKSVSNEIIKQIKIHQQSSVHDSVTACNIDCKVFPSTGERLKTLWKH